MENLKLLGGGDCNVVCSNTYGKMNHIQNLITAQLELKRVNKDIKNIEWAEKSLLFENKNIEQIKNKLDTLNKKTKHFHLDNKNLDENKLENEN